MTINDIYIARNDILRQKFNTKQPDYILMHPNDVQRLKNEVGFYSNLIFFRSTPYKIFGIVIIETFVIKKETFKFLYEKP